MITKKILKIEKGSEQGQSKNTYIAVFYYICFIAIKKAYQYQCSKSDKTDIDRVR
jgi:hypothetical protein